MPGGRVYTTENGCFAKTFGLDPRYEPAIYDATTKPDAYLENVSVDADGKVDFFDTSYTKNGRTTWPFSYVDPWPGNEVPPADFLLILNRNENIVPGVARLDRTQAAAYFMLGETTGTSAGGKDEEGKFLRVPGTNPFFPRDMADMGNRMLELLDSRDLQVFVLNTGRVGGKDDADLQEGHHPVLLGHGRGHRLRHHRVGHRPRLRLRGRRRGAAASTTSRSCSRGGCTSGRGARTSTTPRSPGSSRSGATIWPPSPAWTRPSSSRSASGRPARRAARPGAAAGVPFSGGPMLTFRYGGTTLR